MIMNSTLIIAEAGVNHNGDLNIARELIDAAADAGADFIKFQTFKAEKLVTSSAKKAKYQRDRTDPKESQFSMIKKLELSLDMHKELISYCSYKGVKFFSTAFDIESLDMLMNLGLDLIKIPSGEITNLPFLRHIGSLCKPVILSTGMSNLDEIEDAFSTLKDSGLENNQICILHCNTEYPTPMIDVNLKAMLTIRDTFQVDIGYSDHTLGIVIPISAVALGAKVIEKHLTVDRNLKGPDHSASLEPIEFKNMVESIRCVEEALGDGTKKSTPSESKNKSIVRKSLVAATPIKKGELYTEKNISVKRPGLGISPMRWDEVIGKHAPKSFKMDDLIEL